LRQSENPLEEADYNCLADNPLERVFDQSRTHSRVLSIRVVTRKVKSDGYQFANPGFAVGKKQTKGKEHGAESY